MRWLNRLFWLSLLAAPCSVQADHPALGLQPGELKLGSAGPLAFGPEGVLFIGDARAGAVVAIATGDARLESDTPMPIDALDQKIAALLGITRDQLQINDAVVNPRSKAVYVSVTRGRGPDGKPALIRVQSGQLQPVSFNSIPFARAMLPDLPAIGERDRMGGDLRMEAITDLQYMDGHVLVSGLSTDLFPAKVHSLAFPFAGSGSSTSVEIFHTSNGRYESTAVAQTFVACSIDGTPSILAAYTGTPLVMLRMSDLSDGEKITGTTIAELGNSNRPLDMIMYHKRSGDYLLMSNSSRGVMKINLENISSRPAITTRMAVGGVTYETLGNMKGVEQLDLWDESTAMVLMRDARGMLDLRAVPLP